MDNINIRITKLRKILNLSMEKFGNQVGITKSSINAIEKGRNNPSERTIMLICKAYNVSPLWLKEGVGDIFLDFPENELDRIVQDYALDENDKLLIETFLESSESDRQAIKNFLQTFAKKIEQKADED
ncbi:MAG: helix-turn-helix domain-containing protein [Thomasclavelia sp.]